MRVFRQIAGKCLSLLIFIVLAQLLAHAAVFAVDACYAALHKWFGNAFPLYSPIADREQYDAFRAVIDLISYAIALYFSVYLSIMISNKPNEHLIKETDGFYTLPRGFGIYFRSFVYSDAVASALVSLLLILPIAFIPDAFFTTDYSIPLKFLKLTYDVFGVGFGAFITCFVIFGLHYIAIFPAMSRWRAAWLTGFAR